MAEADDVVWGLGFLGHVTDQIMAGGIVLIFARCCNKFNDSHMEMLLYQYLDPGLLPQGDAQCIPGIPNKVFVLL